MRRFTAEKHAAEESAGHGTTRTLRARIAPSAIEIAALPGRSSVVVEQQLDVRW
jgi:hypothetical protein